RASVDEARILKYCPSFETTITCAGEKMLVKKFALVAASAMLATTVAFATSARPAYAKVDCDAVMNEVNSGKHNKDIAADLKISTSSVYRCKRKAKAAAKSLPQTKSGREVPAAPAMAASSPAAAASPTTK